MRLAPASISAGVGSGMVEPPPETVDVFMLSGRPPPDRVVEILAPRAHSVHTKAAIQVHDRWPL